MREMNEQLQLLQPTTGSSSSRGGADVDELTQYDRMQANLEYRQEEHGIGQYGEDYTDGDYYGEDDADEY
jgi:hypothetical protein